MFKRLGLYKKLMITGLAIIVVAVGLIAVGAPYWVANQLAALDEWHEEGHKYEATIEITPNGFVPATLSVNKETRVYFENHDTTLHKIVANPGSTKAKDFGSGDIEAGGGYAFSFHGKGNFTFHDEASPTNNGEIVVK